MWPPSSPYILHFDYELSAQQLFDAYDENEVAADQKYKGKKILLTGIVESINKDIMGDCYIILKTNSFINNVHCSIKNANAAASVKKGQEYSFLGECSGLMMGSVILSDCSIR